MFKRFLSITLAFIMVLGMFPVSALAEEVSSEEILPLAQRINIEENYADYFYKATNQTGDYVEFDCMIEGDEQAVLETFDGRNAFELYIETPNSEFSEMKEIWWGDFNATDEYRDTETGELAFDGMLCLLAFVDENGNLINTYRNFKVVWENAEGETYTDEVSVAYYFPQIPEEDEGPSLPESTPVSNQTLTVWYVEGSTYKRVLAEAEIVDGKVEVTVPYITDEEVRAIEADGNGRKRARLAFCINDEYDGENADSVTHFMGGFGENIMDYVNWEEQAGNFDSFSDYLLEWYLEINQFGEESVVKYEVARDTNGEMRRWIEPGESYSERLYIQYFDAVNKEAVAYEHIDVTLNVADIYPSETEMMPFGQVELNGYKLNAEEIGYVIGVNGDTNELIVEMSTEQLLAKENTKDEDGNINNRFEFSAPSDGDYKFVMAIGEKEISAIGSLTPADFENDYDPENKPSINFVVGYFEDGNFYRAFEEDKKTSVCFAWYDGTSIVYQSFKLCQCMLIETAEILNSWNGNFAEPSDVVLEINGLSDTSNFVSGEYVDGIYTVTVDSEAITEEQWERMYRFDDRYISASVGLEAPEGTEYAVDDATGDLEYYEDYSAGRSDIGGFYPYNEELAPSFYTYLGFGSFREENENVKVFLNDETEILYYQIAYYIPESETFEHRLLPIKIVIEGPSEISFGEQEQEREYLPDGFHDYWDESELITYGQIEVTAHSAIRNYLDAEFNSEGVLVITVNNIPAENWEMAYNDLPAGEYGINVTIEIDPPRENIVAIADNQGNGPTYENLKNQYAEDPDQIEYHNHEGMVAGSLPVGEVLVEGNEVSVFPTRSGGVFYRVIFWKDAEGNVIQQILPFVVEVADDAESVTFNNGRSYISEERIEKDGRTSVLSGNYDSENGILKYSYIGTKTSDADIADDIKFGYGENDPVYNIQTRISAPEEGYTYYGEEVVVFNLGYVSPDYPLVGSRGTFEIEWVHETKEPVHEVITIEFDPGKVWMDKYWTPISDSSRLIYYSITNGHELMSSKDVRDAGVILELFQKPGKIHTSYDNISNIDIEKIANLEAWVLPPDAVERNADESLNEWVERIYRETEYVGTKVGATGVGDYELGKADMLDQFVRSMNMLEIGTGAEASNIAGFGELNMDNLRIWFATRSKDRNGHVITIDWYKEGEIEPSVREYIYNEQESLVVRENADSVTEEELTTEVEVPTPVDDVKWKLTTNHFPQISRYGEAKSYYFQLEGDENTPEGDKIIYLPYSFIDPELDYEKAVEMKLKPKLHHYDDGHTKIELIKGELTPYGIRFVVSSFSPFVLDWSEDEEVANSGKNKHPETAVFEVPESLEDFIETSYDPETGVLTVNVGKGSADAWKAAYENIGTEDTAIGGDVILTAPEGTVKQRRVMGGIDFEEFVEWAADPDSPLFDECDPEWPYSYSLGEFAHVNRTGGEVIITPEGQGFDVAVAWQDANKNIIHQIIRVEIIVEEQNSIKFDDPLAGATSADVSRIDFMGGDSELFSPYKSENVLDYENGLLTYTYIGSGTTPDEIREDILSESENESAAMEITVLSPKEKYYLVRLESQKKRREYDVSEEITNANLNSEFKDFGELVIRTEKYVIYWQNSEAPYDKIIETVDITYDVGFEVRWMNKYWDSVDYSETNTGRIDISAEKNGEYQEVSISDIENAGINVEINNGHFDVNYDKDIDIEIAKEMIAYIAPPANAVYYIENGCGGMGDSVGDFLTAEEQNDLLTVKRENGEFITYGNGNVPCINLSHFEFGTIGDLGINFWYTSNSGYIQIELIDWYDANYQLIKREYIYATYGEYVNQEEAEATPEVNEAVTAPTPIGEGWKLTTNHYPQKGRNDEYAYYFELEASGNVPEGEKAIYIPYSYLDENLTYEKAFEMKLRPKLHHYDDGHTRIELIKGELTPYGMKFVVSSFSPFVVELVEEYDDVMQEFEAWWETAPKIDINRVDLSFFDAFKTDGTVETSYENGVLEITINNTSPEIWAKVYNENSAPSFGEKQETMLGHIRFRGVDGTVACCVETTGNAPQYVMNFENYEDKYFMDSASSKKYLSIGNISIYEDGSAEVIPQSENSSRVICMAWQNSEGKNTCEYIKVIIKVSPEDTIIKIPEGKINTVKKIEDINRISFDVNYNNFIGTFDQEYSEVIYQYTGSKKTIEEIATEIAAEESGSAKYFVTQVVTKEGYKITDYEISSNAGESWGKIVNGGEAVSIGQILMFEDSVLATWEQTEVIIYSESKTNPSDIIAEKISVGTPFFNITWMEYRGFEPIPADRIVFNDTAVDRLGQAGVNIEITDGGFTVCYENEINVNEYERIDGQYTILPPNGAVTGKFTGTGGEDHRFFYKLNFGEDIENDINNSYFGPAEDTRWGTQILNCNTVEGITYYYSGPAQYVAYLIMWEMEDGTYKKEYVTNIFEEYINSINAEAVPEINETITVTTPIGEGWKLTTNHYPQKGRNDAYAYYFELEASGNVPDGEKAIYIPYSYIDETLTYEKALEMKLSPKLHHYDDGHIRIELIKGELTPYGMKFVVSSFSPFIVELSEDSEQDETAEKLNSWNGNIAEESEVSLKIKGISDISGFVSGEYVDGVYTITVTPENITTEQWQQMYKNALIDQQYIYLWVGINAPEGTTKAIDNSREGLKNYDDFVAETADINGFYNYSEENALEFAFPSTVATAIKSNGMVTVFPEDNEDETYYQIAFYDSENDEIIRRLLPFKVVLEGNVENITFEEPDNFVPEERLTVEEVLENIISSYDESVGELVYTYIGGEKDANAIINIYDGKTIATTVEAPEINGTQYYYEGETSVTFEYDIVRDGELITAVSKKVIEWTDSEGNSFVENLSIEFNPQITYMDIYWEQIAETDRIEFINKKGETVSAEVLEQDGLKVRFDENGFIVTEYELDLDPETVTRTWVEISKPEGEFVGYKTINYVQNFTGYPSYDMETANYRDADIKNAEFHQIGEETVLGWLGELDSLEVGDITFWYANEQGSSRPVFIDWYKKLPTDSDFDFERDVVREYVYVQGSDFVFEETANSVTEEELTTEVEVPTPVDDVEWKLTTNHFPQISRYSEARSYYFQLEGDENTPEGDKIIYLPYSFIDPELDYEKAVDMKLKPKLHHYDDGHTKIELIKGELTPYGIRFVVSSFSPFVLDWSDNVYIGETAYESLSEALNNVAAGETITIFDDIVMDKQLCVYEGTALDLNGYNITAEYATIYGDIVDTSADNSGRLIVDSEAVTFGKDNPQLPVKTEEGYAFVEFEQLEARNANINGTNYNVVFEPRFEEAAVELLEGGNAATGVEIVIRAEWEKDGAPMFQDFVYNDNLVTRFLRSYNSERGKFGLMFTFRAINAPEDTRYTVIVRSENQDYSIPQNISNQ